MAEARTAVCIYTRKDKPEEMDKVREIEKVVTLAAQVIRKEIDVSISNNLRDLASLSVNASMTPIVTINGASAFAKEAPSLVKMQTALATTSSSGEMF